MFYVRFDDKFFSSSIFLSFAISTAFYFLFVYECDKKYELDRNETYLKIYIFHALEIVITSRIVLDCGFDETKTMVMIVYQIIFGMTCTFNTIDFYATLNGMRKLKTVGNAGNNFRSACEDCKNRELQAIQSHPKIDCKVCRLEYSEIRIPRYLRECGHTVCETCADTLLKKNQMQFLLCPFCKIVTAVNGPASMLQTNYAVLDIINNLKR